MVRKLKEDFEAEKVVLETALAREKARSATIYNHGVAQTIMIARRHRYYTGPDADDDIYPAGVSDPEYFKLAFNCSPPPPPPTEEDTSEGEEEEEEEEGEESTGDSEDSPLAGNKGVAATEETVAEEPVVEEKAQ